MTRRRTAGSIGTSLFLAAACSAASPSTGDDRLDMARKAVRSGFGNPNAVSFRDEKVAEINGQEGSKATVVCGQVNRSDRSSEIEQGWQPYYYVVSYRPAPVYGPPDLAAMRDNEPGAFGKIALPMIYSDGDFAVLFGPASGYPSGATAAEAFRRSWEKFCTGQTGPMPEYILQTWR